jgi:GNAT superfamily N-acetyltransferase
VFLPLQATLVLAVQPAWRRDGLGTALLASYHQVIDHDDVRLLTYLQAADPAARRLFRRHGYHDQGPLIHLPEGPALIPMWRQPATTPIPLERTV